MQCARQPISSLDKTISFIFVLSNDRINSYVINILMTVKLKTKEKNQLVSLPRKAFRETRSISTTTKKKRKNKMKDTNKKIKPGEKKNVHTTTKSYTFKTRVITIFVHSAAATRKQKQTDAAGRDEPSKTPKTSHTRRQRMWRGETTLNTTRAGVTLTANRALARSLSPRLYVRDL
jgi:hypothetical protein